MFDFGLGLLARPPGAEQRRAQPSEQKRSQSDRSCDGVNRASPTAFRCRQSSSLTITSVATATPGQPPLRRPGDHARQGCRTSGLPQKQPLSVPPARPLVRSSTAARTERRRPFLSGSLLAGSHRIRLAAPAPKATARAGSADSCSQWRYRPKRSDDLPTAGTVARLCGRGDCDDQGCRAARASMLLWPCQPAVVIWRRRTASATWGDPGAARRRRSRARGSRG
jgi:hypothetical protein